MKHIAVFFVLFISLLSPFLMIQDDISLKENQNFVLSAAECANETYSSGPLYADIINGNDEWPGTIDCPKISIQSAIDAASDDGEVIVKSGTYHEIISLNKPGITLTAAEGERVILDGTESVNEDLGGDWEIHDSSSFSDIIWKADLSKDAWQLFIDYEEEMPARWPNANFSDDTALNDNEYWAHGNIDDGDYETDSSTSCNEGMVKYQSGIKYYCLNYVNGELQDDGGTYAGHDGLIDSGIDATGAIAVLNIGSFRTWSRNITSHTLSNGSMIFDVVPSDEWKYKHHMYFLTQKLNLLDTPGEWFFDHESSENTVYYMPRDGQNPNLLNIRMKTQAYSILCSDDDGVVVDGFDFFATTFSLDDCDASVIKNSNLVYPSTSKRSLGYAGENADERFVSRVDDCIGCIIDKCTFIYTDGAAFEAHGGVASSMNNQINNSYFYYIDWSGSDQKSLMTTIMMDGTSNLFTNNTMHKTGTSATIRIGNAPKIMFNEIYDTAYIQSDGTVIQMMQAEQEDGIVAYNWIHDVPKYGIRMDGPFGGENSGRNASVHHNVLWNANGAIVSKGDYHNVSSNTVLLGIDDDRNHIIVLYDDTGGNENSTIMNNAANSISGHRTNSNSSSPIPVNTSTIFNNWNGYDTQNTGENISSQLIAPFSNDFRPITNSEIDIMGAGAYSSSQTASVPASNSIYDPSTYYWLPGIKHDASNPYQQTSFDLPCSLGTYRITSGGDCIDAPAGYYVDIWNGELTACAAGTYNANTASTTSSDCFEADAGYYVDQTASTSQTECAVGTWQNQTNQTSCFVADAGYYVDTTASISQTPCAVGTWQNQTNQTSCFVADAGYYVDQTASTSQTECAVGTWQNQTNQTSCFVADAGYYVDQTASTSQTECAVGTWQNQTNQTSCFVADAGYYVDQTASTSQTECAVGTWQNQTNQTSCFVADAGYYVDQTASTSQTPCAVGTWQNQTNQTSCFVADAGYYVDTTASISQTPCAVGTWQNQTNQTSCFVADAGYYVDQTASTSQTECAVGTWQNQTNQTSCFVADAGYYVDQTASTSQTECAVGTWQNQTNQTSCFVADAGYYVDQTTASTSQTECAVGTWQNQTNQTSCFVADAGYYVDQNSLYLSDRMLLLAHGKTKLTKLVVL